MTSGQFRTIAMFFVDLSLVSVVFFFFNSFLNVKDKFIPVYFECFYDLAIEIIGF